MTPSRGGGTNMICRPVTGTGPVWAMAGREQQANTRAANSSSRPISYIVLPLQFREQIVPVFTVLEECFVEGFSLQKVVEASEAQNVITGSFSRIGLRGTGLHEKGPVARLCQQQLAPHLPKHALFPFGALLLCAARAFRHPPGSGMQMGIDPGIGFVEPDFPKAFVPPTRRARADDLQRIVSLQVAAWRCELQPLLVVDGFADEEIKKGWAFEPPVTKEFRIKRAENDRLDVRGINQVLELFRPAGHKVPGVVVHCSLGPARDIDFLLTAPPGDAVILDSGEFPVAVGRQKGPEVIEIQVVTDIAVKVAVGRIAR